MDFRGRLRAWAASLRNGRALRESLLAACLVLAICSGLIRYMGESTSNAMRKQLDEELTQSARAFANSIDTALFASLTQPGQEGSPAYETLYHRVHQFREWNPVYRYAYTCRALEGVVVFVVDGTPRGDADRDGVEDHSFLMQPYPEASENLRRVLREGGAGADKSPYRDAWGTFQSGCAAIQGPADHVLGAACLDMDLNAIQARLDRIREAEWTGFGLAAGLALGTFLVLFEFRLREGRAQARLEALRADLERQNRALQESRECLVEAQSMARLGHWNCYPDENRIEWSEELYRIHDYDPAMPPPRFDELIQQIHPGDRAFVEDFFRRGKQNLQPFEFLYRKTASDGSLRYLFLKATPLCDLATGRIVIRGVTQDMTPWRLIETALVEAKEKAEAATKAKSEFLAMMSHEIRTPINGVMGMAHLLEETGLDDEQQDFVKALIESAEHLSTLISDILDLSKIEAGHMEMERTPFDLERLALAVCDIMKTKAFPRGISLKAAVELGEAKWVSGDPGRVRQVLFNLVGNAVKFTEQGGVEMNVAAIPDRPGWFSLTVSDSGIGMTEKQLRNLFQPFKQGDTSTSRKFGGTGLGLAITSRLVGMLGGSIRAESRPGAGSVFKVELPMPHSEPAADPGESPLAACGFGPSGPGASLSVPDARRAAPVILLAEDNLINQKVALRMLEKLGCKVVVAADGVSALRSRWDCEFDLVLMDCLMPVMDGYESTRAMRAGEAEGRARVPVIACTASVSQEEIRKCREAGMDAILSKPYRPEKLREIIEKWTVKRTAPRTEAAV